MTSAELIEQVTTTVDFFRGLTLDAVEEAFGDDPRWPRVRGRLLKCYGDRGLQHRLAQLITLHTQGQEDNRARG